MGENGAGKSTLIKALTGINQLAAGTITVDGKDYRSSGPADAEAAGISTVYQEVNLCPKITVAENIMLGHEIRRGSFIDWRATRSVAREQLKRMHLDIDPRSQLSSHTIAVQQLCAIARALVTDARVLILDEPTSPLDRGEVAELFNIIRELRDDGVAILFVSHFLELGHRRILHIAGSQDWGDGRIRARAYSDRMAEAGLDVPPIIYGDWQADFGYEVGIDAATLGDATAVFVSNDQMALGLLHGLHSRGICVPDDLSIVGFDDIPEAKHFIPPLTTVRQDFHKLGRRAVRRLIDRLEGAEPTPNEMIAPKFTLRESTAPLR